MFNLKIDLITKYFELKHQEITKVKNRTSQTLRKFYGLFLVVAIIGVLITAAQAAQLSPSLQKQLPALSDGASVGTAIVAFNTSGGLTDSHINVLRSVGVTGGKTFPTLGMVAMEMTAGQVRALSANPAIRSIWSNDKLYYYMHQAKVLTGVDKLRFDRQMQTANGGMPVSGAGDFSVLVIDSGVDATHEDLKFGTKTIQNVQVLSSAGTIKGFTPNVSIENVPDTDQSVGHGTHCAGIIGGTGIRSGGLYGGVAPGAKIIGSGLGAGLFVLNAIGAWEWGLANQYRYNIKVVSNSYGGGTEFQPNNPLNLASKMAYDRNITVVFAGANSGPTKGTLNNYAQAPWVIAVAAGTKEGGLADFSSRGLPKEERVDNGGINAPTITAPGTGRAFETNAAKFTSAIVSTRSTSNLTANGLTDDAELPASAIPFYTQISGTSMATPFVAGVVALMLDADPTLNVDEIRQILVETATRMPGFQDYEVGAGYINAYAAVDKVFNRSRAYKNLQDVTFNTKFGEERPAAQPFHINFNPAVSGAASQNAKTFTVEPGMNVLDVFANVDTALEDGDGNLVGIRITSPSGVNYSTAIDFPVIGSTARQIVVQNPEAGTWTLEVRGARGLAAVPQASSPIQLASPGPVDGTVSQIRYILPNIGDINGNANQSEIEKAIKSRLIDAYADGTFRPDSIVTREDFARTLLVNTPLRQTVGATARFTDVTGDLLNIAQAVTANGSTLRDFDFTPKALLSASGSSFNPAGTVSRLDMAVAFVRALGHDTEARNLANSNVTFNGQTLSDNAQIPAALRGYVQIAINNGLFEAYPAEVRNLGGGKFEVLPGPRFEPATTMNRGTLAGKLNKFNQLFVTGN